MQHYGSRQKAYGHPGHREDSSGRRSANRNRGPGLLLFLLLALFFSPASPLRFLGATRATTTGGLSQERMMTRDTYRRRERALVCHAQIDRAHSEKSREETLKELAEPLLDEALIRDVILSWTRPLPSSYLTSPLVLVGPSGVGKNRLVKYLRKDYNKFFAKVVTHTTRQPRSEEINGTHYHFVSTSRFAEMVECEAFLEHSVVHGRNSYGLSMEAYKKVAQQGKIAIFEVDVQGARKLRAEGLAELHNLTPRYIFIAPTSIEMLRERLVQRGTEDDADIAIRLETAAHEIETSKIEPGLFDRVLVNEDLEKTAHALFRAARDWYPALPSPARLRMLQRRLSKIKRLGVETTTAALSPPPSNGPADSIHYSHEESGKNE